MGDRGFIKAISTCRTNCFLILVRLPATTLNFILNGALALFGNI